MGNQFVANNLSRYAIAKLQFGDTAETLKAIALMPSGAEQDMVRDALVGAYAKGGDFEMMRKLTLRFFRNLTALEIDTVVAACCANGDLETALGAAKFFGRTLTVAELDSVFAFKMSRADYRTARAIAKLAADPTVRQKMLDQIYAAVVPAIASLGCVAADYLDRPLTVAELEAIIAADDTSYGEACTATINLGRNLTVDEKTIFIERALNNDSPDEAFLIAKDLSDGPEKTSLLVKIGGEFYYHDQPESLLDVVDALPDGAEKTAAIDQLVGYCAKHPGCNIVPEAISRLGRPLKNAELARMVAARV